jgi:hypothetical protein
MKDDATYWWNLHMATCKNSPRDEADEADYYYTLGYYCGVTRKWDTLPFFAKDLATQKWADAGWADAKGDKE